MYTISPRLCAQIDRIEILDLHPKGHFIGLGRGKSGERGLILEMEAASYTGSSIQKIRDHKASPSYLLHETFSGQSNVHCV